MERLYKTFSADVKALPDARTIKFLISTDSIDRDGDVLDPKGWDVAAYKKNPVVLWSHDYSGLPIARAIHMDATEHGLAATAEFPAKGVHPFADTVYELLKGGFLSAASVGFNPLEYTDVPERRGGFGGVGRNYVKQELLEFSVVPVPANPEALVQLSMTKPEHKGLLKPLVDWSEKFLGEYYGERGVWLPASQVEKTFEVITKAGILKPDYVTQKIIVDGKQVAEAVVEHLPAILQVKGLSNAQTDGAVTKPLPVPEGDETDEQFMSRCMAHPHMNEKFPDEAQRSAVCHSQMGKAVKHSDSPDPLTLEVDDDLFVELSEDVYDIDPALIAAWVQECYCQIRGQSITEAVTQAINYARGRV